MTKPSVLTARRKYEVPQVISNIPNGSVLLFVAGRVNKLSGESAIIKIGQAESEKMLDSQIQCSDRYEMMPLALWWATGTDLRTIKQEFQYAALNGAQPRHYRGIGDKNWFTVDSKIRAWLIFMRKQRWVTTDKHEVRRIGYVSNPNSWLPPARNEQNSGGIFDHIELAHQPRFEELETDTFMDGDYYSPSDIAKICREDLWKGIGIDLDPASCRVANNGDSTHGGIQAHRYFGMREDGLTKRWDARTVWLNPPYMQWGKWIPKALHEFDSGHTGEMCILSASTTSTAEYFSRTVARSDAILIPRARWDFWGPKSSEPPTGHFLYYFGPNRERFRDVFKHLGAIKGDF